MEALSIRTEDAGIELLKFNPGQEVLWTKIAEQIDEGRPLRFVVLKGRQIGVSTLFEALTFVLTIARPNVRSLVVAHDLETAHSLLDMSKRFYEHLAMPKLRDPKVSELVFPFKGGDSTFRVASAGSLAKGRGTTQTCLHFSEVAYYPSPDIRNGLVKALPSLPDTLCVDESTPNGSSGPGGLFYRLWNQAVRGESDATPVFIAWHWFDKYRRKVEIARKDYTEDEEQITRQFNLDMYQIAWRRWAIINLCDGDEAKFNRDYPDSPEVAFVSSGLSAFDRKKVLDQRSNIRPPARVGNFDKGVFVNNSRGHTRVWQEPQDGHQYVVGADVAEGIEGGDYSCAQVLDMATMEQVCSVHGHIPPHDFAILLGALGNWYNKAILAIEVYPNGFGVQDILIRSLHYANLHRWRGKPDKIKEKSTMRVYGWETNVWSRLLLVEAGQDAFNRNKVTLHEDGLIEELLVFSKNDNGKYEAEEGHDDRVMALLIALRSREENYHLSRPRIHTSAEGPNGVRIVNDIDGRLAERKKLSQQLRQKAQNAVTSWMQM